MPVNEDSLFERGKTYTSVFGSAVGGATDGAEFLGVEKEFIDRDWANPPKMRSGTMVRCRLVRNLSTIQLAPKRLVQVDRNALGVTVLGYVILGGFRGFPVDEFLPAAGVQNNDIFWIVVRGLAKYITPLDGGADNVITQGQDVTSLTTSSSSQGVSAGMVKQFDASGATTPLFNEAAHVLGVAMSSMTTANTGADLLVDTLWLR